METIHKLSFEDWLFINEDELMIEFAETGADREMDFDLEESQLIAYNKYLADEYPDKINIWITH